MTKGKLKPGWKTWRFDQFAISVNDRIDDPSKSDAEYYVGLEHLDPESLKIRRWGVPTDVEATKLIFKKGDIILGRRRVYQRKLAVAEFDGICSAHAMVLRPREDVVAKEFLPFFMQSDLFMERALAISVGSLSPTINWKTLAKQEFALPPLDEQRRIAEVLWAAETTERALLKLSSKVDALQLAVREELLAGETVDRIKLGDVLNDIVPGKSLVGINQPPENTSQYAVLKVSAVGKDRFLPAESKVLVKPEKFMPQFSVHEGDVLITRANTSELVGMVCVADRDYPNLMLSDKTLKLIPSGSISPFLLIEILKTSEVRIQIRSCATGTGGAMKNISQEKLRNLRIPLVSQSSMSNALAHITEVMRNKMAISRRRDLFTSTKMRLIGDLVSGGEV